MDELKLIISKLLKEIESKEKIVNVKGGRGGGPGSVFSDNTVGVLRMLGNEEGENQKEYILKPVEISKAFKKRK